jgi:hypothetical protein
MLGVYDDNGIRFNYPAAWELQLEDDGSRTTVTLNEPGGTAFAVISLDSSRPDPSATAAQALAAMRDDYPELDASSASETIDGHDAVGHDLEFFSLDFLVSCIIRSYQTHRHTVLVLGQWSDTVDSAHFGNHLARLRASLEDTLDDE